MARMTQGSAQSFVTKDGENAGILYENIIGEFRHVDQVFCLSVRSEHLRSQVSRPTGLYGMGF